MSSEGMSGSMLEELRGLIISGDGEGAKALISSQLDRIDPLAAIEEGMAPAMGVVGDRFGRGEVYLPEMIKAANAFEEVMTVLRPKILESGRSVKRIGTVVIGAVQTDIHEIGKNIVANMLSTGGFEVHDLGADVSPLSFIDKAEEVGADIIAASSIMTTTMPYQKDIIDILDSMGFRDRFKVIVGGGPVNAAWGKEIRADGYADTAPEAVKLARELMSGKS